MARKLSTAILRSASGVASIDTEAGVIRGVKLMERGATAHFRAGDGKPNKVVITDKHISALLSHAGNRAIPIHNSHEWFQSEDKPNADSVEMSARIGALKGFRKNENGDLIADAYLNKAKPAAMDFLWGAEMNPEANVFSAVFNYLKDDPDCIPVNFRAADLVPDGAATTALFSDDQTQNTTMDETELLSQMTAAGSDPHKLAAMKACIKSMEKAGGDSEDKSEDTATAEMEETPKEEKKKDDDQTPALMSAFNKFKTELLSEVGVKIKAEVETARLGGGKFLGGGDVKKDGDVYTATLATYKDAAKGNEVLAVARMLKDKPELLGEFEIRQRARVAKMSNVPA